MKNLSFLLIAVTLVFGSCRKATEDLYTPAAGNSTASPAAITAKGGGSGSGGGNNSRIMAPSGPITGIGVLIKHEGGINDSIWIGLNQATQGTIITLSSSNPSLHVPTSVAIPAGATFGFYVQVSSSAVSSTQTTTVTASLTGQSKTSAAFNIYPAHVTFTAPQLSSPGNGSKFKNRLQVTFSWAANVNAYYHDIQISDNAAFSGDPVLEVYTDNPIFPASYFNGLGIRYWRVRYIDGSGSFGPWSAVRNFQITN